PYSSSNHPSYFSLNLSSVSINAVSFFDCIAKFFVKFGLILPIVLLTNFKCKEKYEGWLEDE
ncbi:hypothetical protein N3930_42120, partial [Bacillus thuringiensis]|nr:hypothetical protein [Bacillus thuringiensis]